VLDLVLRDATIVDGTGAPSYAGDVAVAEGRVVALGRVDGRGDREIDCGGRVVCPGFVDLHTHYDAQLLWDGSASPSPLHGVTTVLAGNCGFSIAPLGGDDADYVRRMMAVVEGIPLRALEAGAAWDWRSFGDYLDRLDGAVGPNVGVLVGHSTVRRVVMGDAATREPATAEQLAAMVELVHRCLAEGALGFSSSLGEGHTDGDGHPVPSRSASFEETVALAGTLRDHPGTTLEFIPTVGPIAAERMELMADMSLAADRPLNWNLLGSLAAEEIYEQQLTASDVAAARGAYVVALTLPDLMRLRSSTVLEGISGWREVMARDAAARRAAVDDPATRAVLRESAQAAAARSLGALGDFATMEVADADSPWVGRPLGEVAGERGVDVVDVLLDVVLVEGLTLAMVLPSLVPSLGRSDEGWRRRVEVWQDPRVLLGGSDAGAHLDLMCHANYPTVVLGEVVRERGLLTVEQAVAMMTDRPARLYGLRDRGRLRDGAHADLVVFDPASVASTPAELRTDLPGGAPRLHATARGVDHVFVNGVEVASGGAPTDARPGTVLRSGRDTETVDLAAVRQSHRRR
jgi:N-acyl-D-aspartate/D-glutamate deacylase